MSRAGLTIACVIGAGTPVRAERWAAVPSVTVVAIYDDNIFLTADPRAAVGVSLAPGLRLAYAVSPRLSLSVQGGLASEYYGQPNVTGWAGRRSATAEAQYALRPETTFVVSGHYTFTTHPRELFPTPAIEYGRRKAEAFGVFVGFSHRIHPKAALRTTFGFQRMQLQGGDSALPSELSGDAGVTLQVGPQTSLALRAGPRYVMGELSGRIGADLDRRFERFGVGVSYDRGAYLAFDRAVVTETFTARASHQAGRSWSMGAWGALSRHWHRGSHRSWNAGATSRYRLTPRLSAFASYDYVRQDRGWLVTEPVSMFTPRQVSHTTVSVGLTALLRRPPQESAQ